MSSKATPRTEAPAAPWKISSGECCDLPEILAADRHARRYAILGVIAHGGMSDIFEAWDERLRRRVAVKTCRRPLEGDPLTCLHLNPDPVVAAFASEMHVLSQLHHSTIIPLYDFGVDASRRLFFTMPLIEGSTYYEVIEEVHAREGSWNLGIALGPLLRVCDALRYAHWHGVVHGDLKPENIAVGSKGDVYILDWGLARVLDRSGAQAEHRTPSSFCLGHLRQRLSEGEEQNGGVRLAGTPSYMPIEYVESGAVSTRFDIYSFGATLYHLLSGRAPYESEFRSAPDPFQVLLEGPPVSLEEPTSGVEGELIRISNRCMLRRPEDRYQSMDAVREALNKYIVKRLAAEHGRRGPRRALAASRGWLRRAFARSPNAREAQQDQTTWRV